MVKVKAVFSGWHEVSVGQAKEFVKHLLEHSNALKETELENYINTNRLQGITVKELFENEGK